MYLMDEMHIKADLVYDKHSDKCQSSDHNRCEVLV